MTVQLVADEDESRKKSQGREGLSEEILTYLSQKNTLNVALWSCRVKASLLLMNVLFSSLSLMSVFQIFHWASPLSDACVWYLLNPWRTEPFRKLTAALPYINHGTALI